MIIIQDIGNNNNSQDTVRPATYICQKLAKLFLVVYSFPCPLTASEPTNNSFGRTYAVCPTGSSTKLGKSAGWKRFRNRYRFRIRIAG